jgi:hypothetical protein
MCTDMLGSLFGVKADTKPVAQARAATKASASESVVKDTETSTDTVATAQGVGVKKTKATNRLGVPGLGL